MILSVHRLGWTDAVFATFDISVIALFSCVAGISLILRNKIDEVRRTDIAISAVLLLLIFLPIGGMSWVAVTGLSLYVLVFSEHDEAGRRGAIILLATTVPMLWSRLLFDFFANFFLEIDASLVAQILGTQRTANVVGFADHSGILVIFPACSSLANVSLALLCWVTLSQYVRHRWHPRDIFWCLVACAAVAAANITRISLMGFSPWYYDTIHSPLGDMVANIVILGLTGGICVLGVRREVFAGT